MATPPDESVILLTGKLLATVSREIMSGDPDRRRDLGANAAIHTAANWLNQHGVSRADIAVRLRAEAARIESGETDLYQYGGRGG